MTVYSRIAAALLVAGLAVGVTPAFAETAAPVRIAHHPIHHIRHVTHHVVKKVKTATVETPAPAVVSKP